MLQWVAFTACLYGTMPTKQSIKLACDMYGREDKRRQGKHEETTWKT